jgi:hypothetical protein
LANNNNLDNSNNTDMANNNKTNFKLTNNQTIISVGSIINNRIVSKLIKINNNKFKASVDLIISNNNSPLSNKTIRVRHLICFENAP